MRVNTMQPSTFALANRSMEGGEIEQAFARIERALARIDAAAARPPQGDGELAARHERLKLATAQALRQLDGLIAEQGR